MDIIWPTLGVIVIVAFVFFVLAQHWQHLLRQQSNAIRQLAQHVQNLEDMADPELRRRLGDAAPVPLEQVFTFTMRLGERFWSALRTTEEDRKYVHDYGSFLASVKLERWRSHTVATVSEILPARKSADLQKRTLDYYPNATGGEDALSLWDLALARPVAAGLRPPSLELLLRGDTLELRVSKISSEPEPNGNGQPSFPNGQETTAVLLRLPLDPAQIEEFRGNDPESASAQHGDGNGGNGAKQRLNSASYWHAFYSASDERLGIDWELRLRDLSKKAEWERWHVWESGAIPVGKS